ncbi:MAG: phosphatase PAP2 family protein [Bacteroidetes bacterium]|nr:phosphatase PAP2 family protein [Bacteroidota bacterium]
MVIATDQVSVFIKDTVQRLRPCHDMAIQSLVHTVHGCGGKFGFVSSHAANSFGVAMFFTMFFSHRWVGVMLMIWALIVSYSRIYLGVHYPGDVLGGALLGMIIGALFFYANRFCSKSYSAKTLKYPHSYSPFVHNFQISGWFCKTELNTLLFPMKTTPINP